MVRPQPEDGEIGVGLRTKFNLVFIVAFLVGLGVAAAVLYPLFQDIARNQSLQQARIMLAAANAIRAYTSQEIDPLIVPMNAEKFLPVSIPSFSAQTNLRKVRTQFPNYVYREAALNPTNPDDRAADWEADIIHTFRNFPDRKELVAERDTPTGRSLSLARPLVVNEAECLTCHSTPANAPPSMLKLYGTANGFGWKLNETIGAQVVSVPMSVPLAKAQKTFLTFMGILVAVFLVILVLLNVLLHFVVVRPVVKMARIATAVSLGDMDAEEYERKGRDEIAALSAAFNRMRRSLQSAMKMLES